MPELTPGGPSEDRPPDQPAEGPPADLTAPGEAAPAPPLSPPKLTVDFAGEVFHLDPGKPFVVGREGDLAIDDNPYLHRTFLVLGISAGMWWVTNAGSRTSATISDADSRMQAWLAPGARMPLVFARTVVWFTAGPTTYELDLVLDEPPYVPVPEQPSAAGGTTIGRTSFTPDQLLLLLALAEPTLRRHGRGGSAVPSLAEAAARLGWTSTRLNRKLDNVCQKLTRQGVKGLHGGPDRLAVDRRSRLVEYALAARLVTQDDLPLLDSATRAAAADQPEQP
jgi:hypothetical protein